MKSVSLEQFKSDKTQLDNFIDTFDNTGEQFGKS